MAKAENDPKKGKQEAQDTKKTYAFTFSEAEYWSIYEPVHQQFGGVWFHRSTMMVTMAMAMSLFALLIFPFLEAPIEPVLYIALGAVFVILFILNALQSIKRLKAKNRIKAYYEAIREGITVTVDRSSLHVKMGKSAVLYPWAACIQARFESTYIQIDLHNAPPVLIPIGKHCITLGKELEAHISEISAELWGK